MRNTRVLLTLTLAVYDLPCAAADCKLGVCMTCPARLVRGSRCMHACHVCGCEAGQGRHGIAMLVC